ncbi:MAG: hypothetical protein FJ191_05310 [Gammaproteobacteria bacterium]|nr:hypothetical protein [Gammaproteobacteria bacterium]
MISVPIAGTGGSITIKVIGYENPAAGNDSDANWLRSTVRVSVGPFAGDIDGSLTTQDFAYFERELSEVLRTLQGQATFQTDEDWLRFEVGMGSRGTATVSGVVKAGGGSHASLRFSFETDQSFLGETNRALGAVAKDFPVKQVRAS